MTRLLRNNQRSTLLAFLAAALSALCFIAYMLYEAQWLQLRHRRIVVRDLPPELEGLRLLHISDLHYGAPGPAGRAIARMAREAAGLNPDLVLFTGDMTDKQKDVRPILPILSEIGARHGKFAVLGNHDHGMRKSFIWTLLQWLTGHKKLGRNELPREDRAETVARTRELWGRAGIRLLENECATVTARGGSVQVCGIDEVQYGFADFRGTAAQVDGGAGLRLLLTHSPDAIAWVPEGLYGLILAGHTHGGQICLPHPTKGKILLSTSGSEFGGGIYQRAGDCMHVSPGVGTTLLPFRLLCRPEITMIELVSA